MSLPTMSASTSPWRIADSVSSASCRRMRNSSSSARRSSGWSGVATASAWFFDMSGPQVQAVEQAVGVGHVADEAAHGQGPYAQQRRRRDDLVTGGALDVLGDAQDLE